MSPEAVAAAIAGGVLLLSNLVANLVAIRKAVQPRPPNSALDKELGAQAMRIEAHGQRITTLETRHEECKAWHLKETGKVYDRLNATATELSRLTGVLEAMLQKVGGI